MVGERARRYRVKGSKEGRGEKREGRKGSKRGVEQNGK